MTLRITVKNTTLHNDSQNNSKTHYTTQNGSQYDAIQCYDNQYNNKKTELKV
jgi:hypothetical protein